MNKYELTVVIDGKATVKKKAVIAKLEKLVELSKGSLGKLADWGVRDLAYKIGKSTTGIFIHFPLELESSAARALNDKLRIEEDIIRYLLVRT